MIKARKKKEKNLFLFVSHEKINFSEFKREIEKIAKDIKNKKEIIYFKQEPCILHVACNSLVSGQKLLEKARTSGWKRSGLIAAGKRIILELMSAERIEFPIVNKKELLVDDRFLKILIKEANKKLERTGEKIQKFEKFI